MRRIIFSVSTAAFTLAWSAAGFAQPSFDELIANLDAAAPQPASLSFDFTASTAAGTKMTGNVVSKGALSNAVIKSEAATGVSNIRVAVIEDGMQWINSESNGSTMVMKIDPKVYDPFPVELRAKSMIDAQLGASQFISDPRNSWRRMAALFDLAVTREEGDNYILEGAPKGGTPVSVPGGQFDKVIFHVSKTDGYPRHAVFQQVGGAAFLTVDLSNLQMDVAPEDSNFQYTPAEGAMIMDLTPMIQQQLTMMANPPAPAPAAAPPAN